MATDTDICNMAISYLGGNSIIAMTDQTPEGVLCNLNYDTARDAVLEDVNWTFATKRFILGSPSTDAPEFGYSHSYLLPQEVIRVVAVNEGKLDWVLEQRNILTDAQPVNLVAVVRIINPVEFSSSFVSCLASRLAAEIALPLTNSPQQQASMAQMYLIKKQWAQGNDGRQGRSKRRRSFVRR